MAYLQFIRSSIHSGRIVSLRNLSWVVKKVTKKIIPEVEVQALNWHFAHGINIAGNKGPQSYSHSASLNLIHWKKGLRLAGCGEHLPVIRSM